MLTEIEFMDKRHIILDKATETVVMNKGKDGWLIYEIPKDTMVAAPKPEFVCYGAAYEYYKERMESFMFRRFPIITYWAIYKV